MRWRIAFGDVAGQLGRIAGFELVEQAVPRVHDVGGSARQYVTLDRAGERAELVILKCPGEPAREVAVLEMVSDDGRVDAPQQPDELGEVLRACENRAVRVTELEAAMGLQGRGDVLAAVGARGGGPRGPPEHTRPPPRPTRRAGGGARVACAAGRR